MPRLIAVFLQSASYGGGVRSLIAQAYSGADDPKSRRDDRRHILCAFVVIVSGNSLAHGKILHF